MLKCMLAFGAVVLAQLCAQELKIGCEPKPETLKMIEALPAMRDYSVPFENRIGPLRALAARNPDDFFIQRYYQDAFRRMWHLADEYDRALALYRERPGRPLSRYFEARLLMNAEPSRSKRTLEELLASNPEFVWPHLDFIEWANLPGRRDQNQVESRLTRFIAACPSAIEAYENARLAGAPELLRIAAQNLRRALERRLTSLDTASWVNLWSLESRAGTEGAELKRRIRADLERIESHPFAPRPELLQVYLRAGELLEDPELVSRFEAVAAREAPHSLLLSQLVQREWAKENPPPAGDATLEQRNAYDARKEAEQRGWAKRWPNDCGLAQQLWFRLVRRAQQDALFTLAEHDFDVMERIERCRTESPDTGVSVPPMETILAEVYVAARRRLDRVPRLIDAGLKSMDRQEKYRISRELIPAGMLERGPGHAAMAQERARRILARYLIASGRTAEAKGLVQQQIAELDTSAGINLTAPEQRQLRYRKSEWIRLLAEIVEKEGHAQEALELYRSTLAGISREMLEQGGNRSVAPIRNLYLANGGTEANWLGWATSAKPPGHTMARPLLTFSDPLPDFSANDLSGRNWRLRDLKGKITFVNYWATWCAPCRAEHAELQILHQRLRDRKDAQVLTISVDDAAALAESYIKGKGYTFPVIHAPALADKLLPYAALPTNFLVNEDGLRSGLYLFGSGQDAVRRVLADIEHAAAASK